jgi:hypothetical protein
MYNSDMRAVRTCIQGISIYPVTVQYSSQVELSVKCKGVKLEGCITQNLFITIFSSLFFSQFPFVNYSREDCRGT